MRVYLKVGPLVQDVDEGFSVHHEAPLLPGPRRVLGLVQVQPDGQPGGEGSMFFPILLAFSSFQVWILATFWHHSGRMPATLGTVRS